MMSTIEQLRSAAALETLSVSSSYLFSIIVPTKNRPEFLDRAIQSINSQNFKDFEIIVVNDGSSVPYENPQDKYKNVRYFYIDESNGVSYARNYAIERSQGKWILFLDDDDVFSPHYLKSLAKEIDTFWNIGIFWSDVTIEIENNGELIKTNRIWPRKYASEEHLNSTALSIGASFGLAIKKELLFKHGMFNLKYKICEDVELITRLISKGVKVKPISRIGVIKYESHKERLSGNLGQYSFHYFYERILDSYQDFFSKNPICKKHILRWALKVHHQVGNRNGVFSSLKSLWSIGDRWYCLKFIGSSMLLHRKASNVNPMSIIQAQ